MNQPFAVRAWTEDLILPTYLPDPPDRNPMFLEKRVYQGSSGRVYPLPFTDRIAEEPVPRTWRAIWIENEFLRVLVLPEIGGRIHAIEDKTNGYELLYRQPVIKPALVGLAGPWISGGIEFNWPQHHRPATFLPVDTHIETHADGSVTVWCSDHDPMVRMKGMHGVCLRPGRAYVELKVRAYNRTRLPQTFLWWANVATQVHEAYQSFFPPDVHYVADHARRSMSAYPLAAGVYYGVDYGKRARKGVPPGEKPSQYVPPHSKQHRGLRTSDFGLRTSDFGVRTSDFGPRTFKFGPRTSDFELPHYAPNDLSFYANIPVPTSYMCMGSSQDFFGGYDYRAEAGIVHFANHHIAPGKKQWTWGNHEFGYAWDRNLTDPDLRGESAPYIEIMAGVYTDNQPDFSFLHPGETKTWSQYWYPIQKIGPAHQANLEAAVSLRVSEGARPRARSAGDRKRRSRQPASLEARFGVSVTQCFPQARLGLWLDGRPLAAVTRDLAPGQPAVEEVRLPAGASETDLTLRVFAADGREIIAYTPQPRAKAAGPPPATEPPAPADIASADELFVTGLHLEQYRHATRCPTLYWREALRRDPLDSRCHNALGLWHLRRGEFATAEGHFRRAIERLTRRNANPYDGEPYYHLGLCLRAQGDGPWQEAYAAFYKATWNQAWAGAAYHALAEMDCCRSEWDRAIEHLDYSLRFNWENTRARNLKVMAWRRRAQDGAPAGRPQSGRTSKALPDAERFLKETLALDPLDWWARYLAGRPLPCDTQTLLDLVLDLARAGFLEEAIELLGSRASTHGEAMPDRGSGAPGVRTSSADLSKANASLPADPRELGAAPLVHYYLGWLHQRLAAKLASDAAGLDPLPHFRAAAAAPPDYCFPARLEEIGILEAAMAANPKDARAPYYLGNLLYDRRRHEEAIRLWERSAKLEPAYSVVRRNLGIGYFNIRRQPAKARAAYDRALRAQPDDARLLYERDQLAKRLGHSPAKRRRALEQRLDLVRQRDDLSVELGALYNQTGDHARALELVSHRHFQPWEGGEGGPLGQHVRSHLALGRAALESGEAAKAREHFVAALTSPRNLGEARHLLANQSDILYWLGCACAALGERKDARRHWLAAATFTGDFQEMRVRTFSELTYFSALSWERLGQRARAKSLFKALLSYARQLEESPAKVDYFATSLPTMLLFEDDLQSRQETTALFLQAQAEFGLGNRAKGRTLLAEVLRRDPNHPLAGDLAGALRRLPGREASD